MATIDKLIRTIAEVIVRFNWDFSPKKRGGNHGHHITSSLWFHPIVQAVLEMGRKQNSFINAILMIQDICHHEVTWLKMKEKQFGPTRNSGFSTPWSKDVKDVKRLFPHCISLSYYEDRGPPRPKVLDRVSGCCSMGLLGCRENSQKEEVDQGTDTSCWWDTIDTLLTYQYKVLLHVHKVLLLFLFVSCVFWHFGHPQVAIAIVVALVVCAVGGVILMVRAARFLQPF